MLLGALSLSYQAAGVIDGPLSDRIGRRIVMVVGLMLQAAGFLAFIWVRSVQTTCSQNRTAGSG